MLTQSQYTHMSTQQFVMDIFYHNHHHLYFVKHLQRQRHIVTPDFR